MTHIHQETLARSMIRWLHDNRDFRNYEPERFKKLLQTRIRHMALDDEAAQLCLHVFRASFNPPA